MRIENKIYIVDGQVKESTIRDGYAEAVELAKRGEVIGFVAEGSNGARYGYDGIRYYELKFDYQDLSADVIFLDRIAKLESELAQYEPYRDIVDRFEKLVAERSEADKAELKAHMQQALNEMTLALTR